MTDIIEALVIGVAGGFAGGMLGIGGGAIYVPALVLLMDEGQHSAQGASLMAIIATGIVGGLTHLRNKNVATSVVWQVAPTAVVAGFSASFLAAHLDASVLQRIFGVVLIYLSLNMIWGAMQRTPERQEPTS